MPVSLKENESTAGRPDAAPPLDLWLAECRQIEEFIERLFGEMDALRGEVQRKAHELELTQARLDEREQQLRLQADESKHICQMLVRQDEQLAAALSELAELRLALAAGAGPDAHSNVPGHAASTPAGTAKAAGCERAGDTVGEKVIDSVRRQFESFRSDARR